VLFTWESKCQVKEALQSFGIPPDDVDLIIINQESVDLDYLLKDHDRVAVFPVFETFDISSLIKIRDKPLRRLKFIATKELAALAKLLQEKGLNCSLFNLDPNEELIKLASLEQRIILTKKTSLLYSLRASRVHLVRAQKAQDQLKEVLTKFQIEKTNQD